MRLLVIEDERKIARVITESLKREKYAVDAAYDGEEGFNLADKANTQLDKLSGGQQQKIQLGVTIMGDPELLIMDEPAKGFDPVNRRLLMNIIEEQRKAGATIIYVTHQMEEVERLCDRLILLKDGQAAAYGTLEEVKSQFGGASMDDIFVQVYGGEAKELRDE